MRTTIDRAGRIVVPKPLRDELSLEPGQLPPLTAEQVRATLERVRR